MRKTFIAVAAAMMTLATAVPCFASPSHQKDIEIEHITPQTMRDNHRNGAGMPSTSGYYTIIRVNF
jgi:hypothetical protein